LFAILRFDAKAVLRIRFEIKWTKRIFSVLFVIGKREQHAFLVFNLHHRIRHI
jgi:hypothetical protein